MLGDGTALTVVTPRCIAASVASTSRSTGCAFSPATSFCASLIASVATTTLAAINYCFLAPCFSTRPIAKIAASPASNFAISIVFCAASRTATTACSATRSPNYTQTSCYRQ